ncbi:acyl--CoA ligase family protein [Chloroflexota bacterium]
MDKSSVNYAPLTPLKFLERTAYVFRDRKAVVYEDKHYSWQEFSRRVSRMSSALKNMGIQKGDRVAFLCRNMPPLLEAHYGVPQAGAVLVTLNIRLSTREITHIVNHSGAKVMFVDETLAEYVKPDEIPGVTKFINITDGEITGPLPGVEYEEFLASGSDTYVKYEPEDENEPISINYTSGTTGLPKGCVYTHRSAYLQAMTLTIEMGLSPYSVYLWTLPMFHCNGWCFPWAVACQGSTSVCMLRPDPEEICQLVEKEGVTHMCGAPIVWSRLGDYMEEQGLKFPHRVIIANGGAAPSLKMVRSMKSKGAEVSHPYGLTESYGPFTICEWQPEWDMLSVEEQAQIMVRQGVVTVASNEMRVVDDDMQDVPADGTTVGEIVMRGNLILKEYFQQPEETAEAFRGGWFHTGDGAVVHQDGYVEIKDRFKDIIISGGENISSIEVENVMYEHPDVLEVACFAAEDEKWGEVVKARVTPKPGTAPKSEEIINFCRQRLAHFKCPKVVEFGEIPRSSTGKVLKYKLRK